LWVGILVVRDRSRHDAIRQPRSFKYALWKRGSIRFEGLPPDIGCLERQPKIKPLVEVMQNLAGRERYLRTDSVAFQQQNKDRRLSDHRTYLGLRAIEA
jgi:hypothetical protein